MAAFFLAVLFISPVAMPFRAAAEESAGGLSASGALETEASDSLNDARDLMFAHSEAAHSRLYAGDEAGALEEMRLWRRYFIRSVEADFDDVMAIASADLLTRDLMELEPGDRGLLISLLLRAADRDPANADALLEEAFETAQLTVKPLAAGAMERTAIRNSVDDPTLRAMLLKRERVARSFRMSARDAGGMDILTYLFEVHGEEDTIARRLPEYDLKGASFVLSVPLTITTVQARLRDDEALVFPHHYDPNTGDAGTLVWVVTKTGQKLIRSTHDEAYFAELAGKMRAALGTGGEVRGARTLSATGGQDSKAAALTFGFTLYRDLLQPAEDMIAGKALVFVPTAALTTLPLQLLVTRDVAGSPDQPRIPWLLRGHAISTIPSLSVLDTVRGHKPAVAPGKAYLGIGDPVFNAEADASTAPTSCADWNGGFDLVAHDAPGPLADYVRSGGDMKGLTTLAALPETAQEICGIERLMAPAPTQSLLGRQASEKELKALNQGGGLERFGVIHFATHGLVTGDVPSYAEPGLVLSVPTGPEPEKEGMVSANDGYLSATEIMDLDLNARLVVLSACDTASSGEGANEALSGLAAAFFAAGTRSMLVSNWPVYSQAAVDLTTRMFATLLGGGEVDTAEALRQAMLALLDSGDAWKRDPAYWAPFSYIGLD